MKSQCIIVISWMLILILAACSGSSDGKSSINGRHNVKYEVSTSTQDASITYLDENGETVSIPRQDTHTSLWSYSFNAKDGAHLSLSAHLLGGDVDTIYVTIYVDELSGFQEHSYGEGVSAAREYDIPMTK
jgi:hypothetical protein